MAAGTPAARAASAVEYVQLLRDHIDKEEGFVFSLADAVLDERALAAVGREFELLELEHGHAVSITDAEVAVRGLARALD
jgi:hemerythrin-like domain-containing protein